MVFVNPLKDKKKINQIVKKNQQRPFFKPHPTVEVNYGVETINRKPIPRVSVPTLPRKPKVGYRPLKLKYGIRPKLPKQAPLPRYALLTNTTYEPMKLRISKMPDVIPEPKPLLEETPLVELRQINPFKYREPARMLDEIVLKTRSGPKSFRRLDAQRQADYICE